jgi:hypothetical protein
MGKHPSTRAARIRTNSRDRRKDTDFFGRPLHCDMFKPNPKNLVYCTASRKEKLQFDTLEAAVMHVNINGPKIKELNGYGPTRAYWCPACCCWHVTSKPKKNREKRGRCGEKAPLAVAEPKPNTNL